MADIRSLRLIVASSLMFAAPMCAQQIADPANLTGEHVAPQSLADTLPIDHGAAALQQLLMKLRSRASMMLIVAHPDDEDGGLLTYQSRGQGARVAMLTLNRGEGGQNLMSGDFGDALGLIRTQELLAAGRYMGVDQFFGTEVDFGFSKTKEESFAKWTHDRVLYDAVRVVRLYRPLVLASVFLGAVTDGHGQHQVAGEITQEVFVAAADPKVFPEMGLPPWAPLKVYARTPFARIDPQGMYDYATGKYSPVLFHNYVTGADINYAPVPTVSIHESEASDRLGMDGDTYVQFARRGLMLQRSQIGMGGRGGGGGNVEVGYTLMASRVCKECPTGMKPEWMGGNDLPKSEDSLFDAIDTSLPAIANLAPDAPEALRAVLQVVDLNIAKAQQAFDPANLGATAEPLRSALKTLDNVIKGTEESTLDATEKFNVLHELRIKRVQCNNALLLAHGVTLDAKLAGESDGDQVLLTTAQHKDVAMKLVTGGTDALKITNAAPKFPSNPSRIAVTAKSDGLLKPGEPVATAFSTHFPTGLPETRPYFSRKSLQQPYYDVSDPNLRNAPATPAPLIVEVHLDDDGVPLTIAAQVRADRDGPVGTAVVVVPPVSVALMPTTGLITPSEERHTVNAKVNTGTPEEHDEGSIRLTVPAGWRVDPARRVWSTPADGHSEPIPFTVTAPRVDPGKSFDLKAVATFQNREYSETYRTIGYPGLTPTNYYTPATYKATGVDVHTAPNLKVAYLPGTGDAVPEFLPNLGVTPTIIGVKDLAAETLGKYDAVVLGVRAYAAHAELAGKGSQPLIDYAKAGGIVIVQYNNGRYGPEDAPYPITAALSSGDHAHDVVEEAQPVQVLVPDAPLLSWPNKITAADFNDWVEERGHGFAGTWAAEYTALLETHDPEQDPQKGGLLVAQVGKGAYIYCGLALYRQLPEGVPGAYRLFANLLSYAKNPKR